MLMNMLRMFIFGTVLANLVLAEPRIATGDSFECSTSQTTCGIKNGDRICCPFLNATCCADELNCCPQNQNCDLRGRVCQTKPLTGPMTPLLIKDTPISMGWSGNDEENDVIHSGIIKKSRLAYQLNKLKTHKARKSVESYNSKDSAKFRVLVAPLTVLGKAVLSLLSLIYATGIQGAISWKPNTSCNETNEINGCVFGVEYDGMVACHYACGWFCISSQFSWSSKCKWLPNMKADCYCC